MGGGWVRHLKDGFSDGGGMLQSLIVTRCHCNITGLDACLSPREARPRKERWTVRVNMTPILILMGAVLFDRSSRFCRALDHTIVHLTLRDVIRHPP